VPEDFRAASRQFTVADAYLYVVLGWTRAGGIERERWPVLQQYHAAINRRPAVQAARAAEGLKP
jgi:glutathione S-transferase